MKKNEKKHINYVNAQEIKITPNSIIKIDTIC